MTSRLFSAEVSKRFLYSMAPGRDTQKMNIEQIKVILLLATMLVVSILAIRIIRKNIAELNRAKIEEPDGSLRDPTMAERMAIANYLAYKSKYFWPLILLIVIIIQATTVLLITGMLTKLIEAAVEIYVKYLLAS